MIFQINDANTKEEIQSIIEQAMKISNANNKANSYQTFEELSKEKVKEEADKAKAKLPNTTKKGSYEGYESIDSLLSQTNFKTEEALNKIKNASDSTKVMIDQEDYEALRPYLELNKRYTARMYENVNNLRKALGLKPLIYVEMTDKEAALLLAHAYASSVAGYHTSSMGKSEIIKEYGNAPENLGPHQGIAVIEKLGLYDNVTPETMADQMFNAVLNEADAYASGQGESAHLINILQGDFSRILFGGVWIESIDIYNAGIFGEGKQYTYTVVDLVVNLQK